MNIWLITSAIAAGVLLASGTALCIRAWQLRHIGRHRMTTDRPPATPPHASEPSTADDFASFAAMVAAEPELAATLRDAWHQAAEEEL